MVAEVRAGINTRNLAVSGDGKTVLVGNYLPHTLVLLDAEDLSLIKVIPTAGQNGKSSRVSAVYQAEPRGSFVAALKDVKEVWEISYAATRIFRSVALQVDDYLDDFFFDQSYRQLIGAHATARRGR